MKLLLKKIVSFRYGFEIAVIISVGTIIALAINRSIYLNSPHAQINDNLQELDEYIHSLPDGNLKGNLSAVILSEHGSYSGEMLLLMKEYTKYKSSSLKNLKE